MLVVQPVVQKDLLILEKLYKECIRDNPLGFIQRLDLLPDFKIVVKDIQSSGGEFFKILLSDTLIGICGIKKVNVQEMELCKFHIAKKFQSKGYGTSALCFVENEARRMGFKKMLLHVSKSQYKAIALYQKLNFLALKEEKCKVELGGEIMFFDTIFMEKEL